MYLLFNMSFVIMWLVCSGKWLKDGNEKKIKYLHVMHMHGIHLYKCNHVFNVYS